MMAQSQPGTPLPNQTSPTSNKEPTSYFHGTPYTAPAIIRSKRGRSDLFSNELGPFFSSTKPADNLYASDRSTLLNVRIQAKMDRGFFLADNDWTCYRRNYFQVSGAFSIHGLNQYYVEQEPHCLVQVDNIFYPVHHFSMNISARVSNSDKKIELVQHTPKRDKGPQTTPMPKLVVPGGNLSMSSVGASQTIVTFERIQFKTATANNGKRRAAQQYYVCIVDLYAEIEGNQRVKVASCQSAPLVVRGRSPGHYSDNHVRYENSFTAPPPPPPHDDRFNGAFPRTPITPPGMMGPADYSSPYTYQPYPAYPHFNTMPATPIQHGMMPPTPTNGLPPTPAVHPQQHSHHPVAPHPQSHPYLMPNMSSEASSSETSSPDLYKNGAFAHHHGNNGIHNDRKLAYTYQQQPLHNWNPNNRMNNTPTDNHPSPVVYEQQSPVPHHAPSYFSSSVANPHPQPTYTNGSNTTTPAAT
ncbi:hypothetical protein BDF20DRAFT_310852 [Mycotypha africana]|uniref:uncharacterized protein n=1 Tax=Mycotypha africana TaxID=64632 RepID=UPI0023010C23|nr:uncharacterized protein BDF20DRAFT_310852 [Mycotypha africana]KAI8988189.1 hypothetical protein BDF20DRAFT_310852 [Mycotypha africana]